MSDYINQKSIMQLKFDLNQNICMHLKCNETCHWKIDANYVKDSTILFGKKTEIFMEMLLYRKY